MCERNYSLDVEPDVLCTGDNGCGGWQWSIPVGTHPYGNLPFGNDSISSCVVPPGKVAQLFVHGFDGPSDVLSPGFYPSVPTPDAYSGAVITRTQNWNDVVTGCCAKLTAPGSCPGLPYGPSGACNPFMMNYCSRNPDVANSGVCFEWYLNNPTFKAQIAEMVCANPANIGHPKCKDWCKQNPGRCDIAATELCKRDPKDPFCTCITSPVTKYNPACVDAQCIGTGYATASMKAMPCPNIVDCSTQIELQTGGRTTTGDITQIQNCGSDEQTAPTSAPSPTSGIDRMILLMFIFILIIIISGFIVIYYQFSGFVNEKK